MTKPLSKQQLQSLEPRYTIAGLFEAGRLDKADEVAMESVKAMRGAFHRWLNPSRGWMSPRMGDAEPPVPRQLGKAVEWAEYKAWRKRWSRRVVAPSPGIPWGLSAADVVTMAITEPGTFNDVANVTGMSALATVELFVAALKDYNRPAPVPAGNFQSWLWEDAKGTGAYATATLKPARAARRRASWRVRKRRQRAKQNNT